MGEDLVFNVDYWVLQTLAMMLTALLIPGLRVSGPFGALIAVIGIAFMNAHLWDTALFFQIPDSFAYQALLLFLANGVLFWILVKLLPGIEVNGFVPAFLAPIVFTVCSIFISKYGQEINWSAVWEAVRTGVEVVKEKVREK